MPTITFNPAPLVALGNKIVTDINAQTWVPTGGSALSFTAIRFYHDEAFKPNDASLNVIVQIAELEDEDLADRGGQVELAMAFEIGVLKQLSDVNANTEPDLYVGFTEALRTFYNLEEEFVVTGTQRARCTKRVARVIYGPEEMDKNKRFFSIIRLTFNGWYAG